MWKTHKSTNNKRPTADRDQAIIKLLLDTGIRAQELCDIQIQHVNIQQHSLKVAGKGKGRGEKERIVYFGKRSAKALWRYLTPFISERKKDDYVLSVGPDDEPRKMKRQILGRLIKRIGKRAGVPNVCPHRFRHTFAIAYLRNGGDPFTLQALLGHTTLEMVHRYLHIVRTDCADAHQRAGPVDNWQI